MMKGGREQNEVLNGGGYEEMRGGNNFFLLCDLIELN